MNRIYLLILLLVALGCSPKEDTTPSMADTDRLETLIDTDIAAVKSFRDTYGTYVLYKFDKTLDFAYQFEQASNWTSASIANIGHDDAEAAMPMLLQNVFNCYGDGFKKEFFPRKLLLVGDITSSSELGLSVPVAGHHTAVANINSVTFARMSKADVQAALYDDDVLTARTGEYHRAILADYLVKARGIYPVGDDYLAYSLSDYASLMSSSRKTAAQLLREDANFFLNRGFFNPDEDESTYFPSAEDDIIAYIRNMITMDAETADSLMDMPMVAGKMHLITAGLAAMGVDVLAINPDIEPFVTMETVQPAAMYTNDVVTDCPKATMEVTILRGSHALDHLVVSVNGVEQQTVDLTSYDKMRVQLSVELDNLVKGANAITLSLYEEGRTKPSVTLNTAVSYATMDEVVGMSIRRSDDHEEVYRNIKVWYGHGGVLDDEENPNLITIAFEKHGWLDRYFMENDAEYRYWKMYTTDGRVTSIVEYLQDGFNEDYTAPLYRITASYTFIYNEDGELTSVTLEQDGTNKVLVSDIVYLAGRMVRYTYDGRIYAPTYATADGITTRVDCLDAAMSGTCFGFDGTEDLNPYYMPSLPAVIPGAVSEVPLQLLYSQYLFKSLDGVWNDGWHRNLDEKVNYAEVEQGGVTWTYRFKLK